VRRLFDKNILFHKTCAFVVCVASIIHIGAHVFNVNALVQSDGAYAEKVPADTTSGKLLHETVLVGAAA